MTKLVGLLFQYLSLSSTYTVAWHCDRVYFQSYLELSFTGKYKVANSQWSGNLRDDHSSTLVILLWCNYQCISYNLSLRHACGSSWPINLINFWATFRIASIGLNVEIRARFFSHWITMQCFQGHVWSVAQGITDARTEGKFMGQPILSPKHIIPNRPFTFLPSAKN